MPHDFVMESGLYALDLIGLHPFRKSGFGYVRAFVFSSTFLVMYILNVAGVIVRYEGIKSLADSVDAIPAGQQVLVKVFAVILIHDRFQKLFAKMDQMWPNNIYGSELELKIQTYQASFKRTFIAYRATIWITTITYISKPLLTLSRSFATAWYIPCDYHENFCYVSIIVAQSLYIAILAFAVVVFDFIFFSFLFNIYCELEKIKFGFNNLRVLEDSNQDDPNILTEFFKLVKHHNFLLRCIKDLNNVYSLQVLNHVSTISATIVFGIFFMNMDGFPPSGDKLYRYIPYLISYNFQLYIYCVIGQEMSYQAENVGKSLYESTWYLSNQPKLRKGMIMVIQISQQQENKLSIGGIWDLNLRIFMSVIKTSVSVHAFMQTIYNENLQGTK
ncbi:odorant receptor 45b-like [Onthophagus taurus]|uniref:odorant receptor 45b-like n=1 Tax=Onthophagus taurus TaxID=166361 RepID=UPI0039BE24D3